MGKYPDKVNQYNHTPRRVFDKYTEKIERKLERLVEDLRDLEKVVVAHKAAILKVNLDIEELEELHDDLVLRTSLQEKKESR